MSLTVIRSDGSIRSRWWEEEEEEEEAEAEEAEPVQRIYHE